MPDRRQHDRRENQSLSNKYIKISLTTFISIILVVTTILISIIVCFVVSKISYNKGYEQCLTDSYEPTQVDFNEDTDLNNESIVVDSEQNIS